MKIRNPSRNLSRHSLYFSFSNSYTLERKDDFFIIFDLKSLIPYFSFPYLDGFHTNLGLFLLFHVFVSYLLRRILSSIWYDVLGFRMNSLDDKLQ